LLFALSVTASIAVMGLNLSQLRTIEEGQDLQEVL